MKVLSLCLTQTMWKQFQASLCCLNFWSTLSVVCFQQNCFLRLVELLSLLAYNRGQHFKQQRIISNELPWQLAVKLLFPMVGCALVEPACWRGHRVMGAAPGKSTTELKCSSHPEFSISVCCVLKLPECWDDCIGWFWPAFSCFLGRGFFYQPLHSITSKWVYSRYCFFLRFTIFIWFLFSYLK